MSSFENNGITAKGNNLLAKVAAGRTKINYTKAVVGDGTLGTGQAIISLTNLISPKNTFNINRLVAVPGDPAFATVGFVYSNQSITSSYYLREIGIFATDPDEGEILYWYGNAGATADFIVPGDGSGSDIIEKKFDIGIYVGQSADVTATINGSLIYPTYQEFDAAITAARAYTDQKFASIVIEAASTTKAGVTKLSNATNSTSQTEASTPLATKTAMDKATKAETDAATAQARAVTAESNAKSYADARVSVGDYGETSNSSNNYRLVTESGKPTFYVDGMVVRFKANTSSGAGAGVTLSVNGLPSKEIRKPNGNQLTAAGAIRIGSIYTVVYNGSVFILQGEGGEYGTATAADVLAGKTIGTQDGLVTGTMVNRTGQNIQSYFAGDSVIPPGYYASAKVLAPVMGAGSDVIVNIGGGSSETGGQYYYNKVISVRMTMPGTYRVKWELSSATNGVGAYAHVYVNGVQNSPTSFYTSSNNPIQCTYDVTTTAPNSTIEIWGKTGSDYSYARIYNVAILGNFSLWSNIVVT